MTELHDWVGPKVVDLKNRFVCQRCDRTADVGIGTALTGGPRRAGCPGQPEMRGDPKWPRGYSRLGAILKTKPVHKRFLGYVDLAMARLREAERLLYNAYADEAVAKVQAAQASAARARKSVERRLKAAK